MKQTKAQFFVFLFHLHSPHISVTLILRDAPVLCPVSTSSELSHFPPEKRREEDKDQEINTTCKIRKLLKQDLKGLSLRVQRQ